MTTQTDTILRLTRVIKADPDAVFRAFTEPEQMKQWFGPEGVSIPIAEVDLAVGGRYHVRMHNEEENQDYNTRGVYKIIDRPRKLSFTWRWDEKDHDAGETLVTVEFNDLKGSTEVVVTHELFPDAEAKGGHEKGWISCLGRLEELFK